VNGYREQLARLAELHRERSLAERCLSLDKRLRELAPAFADAIKAVETRSGWAARLDSFGRAWAWKRATVWLERFAGEHSAGVADDITQTEHQLQETTQTLVALKAWKSCRENLANNPMQEGALKAWHKTVKKGGKWTGKHAETDRRDARKYMQQCRGAIPAWIMPLYRVAEQVEPGPEIFDVVIVDEASQTGPEGLILQYLAKQCVIVGDEKQISPEVGFVDGGQVRSLMEQHLDGIPFWETLNPALSLFDQADVRYGNRIPLREHFRCMPEVIQFSNELCYADTPLIPLRQYPPSRLPPIQVRFVVDGYREGKAQDAINRPEAAAVAKTVIDCLNDSRYKGKSFGVICLQGHAQAQLIESMILEKIGPQPFKDEKTRLLCGDPYSFQGDERDIVFLSMVAAVEGEVHPTALTGSRFEQRFNVAASRARDQEWLFHSIRESDLNRDCMRRRLLHFCYNPRASNASNWDRQRCDSDFERDVGEALLRAGFRVIPQYEFAGKKIDLVVEDRGRQLAIECDGDAWHGPDQYEADMARQRMLERCGWKFIRIRGSVFYANQSKAMEELIAAIRAHGLEPYTITDGEEVPRDWVKEVSGKQCMDALGAHAVATAEENVVQQGGLFPEEAEESRPNEATWLNPAGVGRLLQTLGAGAPLDAFEPEMLSADDPALLDKPVSRLGLSVRFQKCMIRLGISTIGELVRRTGDELLECPHFGVASLNEVREKLSSLALALRGEAVRSLFSFQETTPTTTSNSAATTGASQQATLRERQGEASSSSLLPSSSVSAGAVPQAKMELPNTVDPRVVTPAERIAVNRAFRRTGEELDARSLSARSNIDQQRLEEIVLPVLAHEGFMRHVDTAGGAKYRWG
jgi:very-short-patch-repair endonuclease